LVTDDLVEGEFLAAEVHESGQALLKAGANLSPRLAE
jgi:hypothetical protein